MPTYIDTWNKSIYQEFRTFSLWQRIPIWWKWYYWACPVAWTLYGLVVSQYGDVKDKLESGETVEDFVRSYFGFRIEFVGVIAVVLVGIPVLFASIFAFSIKALNFQTKWDWRPCKASRITWSSPKHLNLPSVTHYFQFVRWSDCQISAAETIMLNSSSNSLDGINVTVN